MIYPENFKKILEKYPSAYIGCGNPGAKILIIGKEAALDLQNDQDQHRLEISSNAGQWRENINNQTGLEDVGRWCDGMDYNPLYPYKGQRFAIKREKTTEERALRGIITRRSPMLFWSGNIRGRLIFSNTVSLRNSTKTARKKAAAAL